MLERHRDEDRLLRLPITYDNAINDPRTNAPVHEIDSLEPGIGVDAPLRLGERHGAGAH